jgi:hypothetical protein
MSEFPVSSLLDGKFYQNRTNRPRVIVEQTDNEIYKQTKCKKSGVNITRLSLTY